MQLSFKVVIINTAGLQNVLQWMVVNSTAIWSYTSYSGKLRKMNSKLEKCSETLLANLAEKTDKHLIFDFRELCGA